MEISVVIATHDRAESLARLLTSIAPQIVPGKHEILIADNGTLKPSLLPPGVAVSVHIHDPAPGKCRVQNRAITLAQGKTIVCLDDDLVVAGEYLDAVERFFREHLEFSAMKGKVLAAENPQAKAGADHVYMDLPLVDLGGQVREVRGVLGANMAFRAEVFAKLGAFDERLGPGACGHEEDTEMSTRIRAAGLRIGYCPGATVYHEVDPARADRARFIRIARERGRCRMLHEDRGRATVLMNVAYAGLRLGFARVLHAPAERVAREDRRLATALGMLEGLRQRPVKQPPPGALSN